MTSLAGRATPETDSSAAAKKWPTMYDLPSEFPEEPGLPDGFHDIQPQLLSRTLSLKQYTASKRFFPGTDINVYYDRAHPIWHKRPDWFLAVDVPRLYKNDDLRRSYVTWDEGQPPRVIVEFISPNTEEQDLGRFYQKSDKVPGNWADVGITPETSPLAEFPEKSRVERTTPPDKFMVYEEYLKVPHYIVYSRYTKRLRYFKHNGDCYEEQTISNQAPLVWLPDLEIGLGLWEGYFEDLPGPWLRWCDLQGKWQLTDTEQAQAKADRLAARLRELGVDPDEV